MQVSGLLPTTYLFDAASRPTQVIRGSLTASLSYDVAGRRTSLALGNGVTAAYTYDAASRLTAVAYAGPAGPLGSLIYSYDPASNRISTAGTWARTSLPQPIPSSTYDAANEQLAFGGTTQTFDANGNLLSQGDATGMINYSWDARNRLIALSGPNLAASFAYDVFGRRIRKTINGITTIFHYDDLDVIEESGPSGIVAYVRTLGLDETLTRTDAEGTTIYLSDAIRSVLATTTPGGVLAQELTYAPFGMTQVSGSGSTNSFQFVGREADGPSLYYFRARYYDPQRGRFLQEDPLGLDGGINAYAYVDNNPLSFIDPLGGSSPKFVDIVKRPPVPYAA